jgi:hypothetical protein
MRYGIETPSTIAVNSAKRGKITIKGRADSNTFVSKKVRKVSKWVIGKWLLGIKLRILRNNQGIEGSPARHMGV